MIPEGILELITKAAMQVYPTIAQDTHVNDPS